MYFVWVIARREFTENIFSLRLLIGLIVCFALFVSSTYVLTEDYEKRLSVHNAAEIEHQNALEEVQVYSQLKLEVAKPPEPLSVICLGIERHLGSTVTVSYEDVPTEAKILGGGNPLLNVFSAVDAVLMVQIGFSLFVISIAYNEYRNQQLHQVKLAQNISRISPTAIYQIGCESLIGTGITHYERFLKKGIEYRRSLLQFTYEEYPFNPNLFLENEEREKLTEIRISSDKIPKFDDTPSNFSTAFAEASLDILLLFLFNLVFFMGAFLAFMRYDL